MIENSWKFEKSFLMPMLLNIKKANKKVLKKVQLVIKTA